VTEILIPLELARGHSMRDAPDRSRDAAALGASWAGRFEVLGGLRTDDWVLDIGCGPGRMAIAIGERFEWRNTYLGFDVSREDIEFANSAVTAGHPNFRFAHLDVRNEFYNPGGHTEAAKLRFPVDDAVFDFAFATSVFTHFFERDTRNYVREAFRALAPGGAFLATFFLLPERYDDEPKNPAARFRFVHQVAPHVRVLYPENPGKAVAFDVGFVLELFAEAGFTDLAVRAGGWRGDLSAGSSQDIVTARKPTG
jgi:SAM-dependent methyltransferase